MTANASQALTTMVVSGRFIMCVFNSSQSEAGCLVKQYSAGGYPDRNGLPHDIVQGRKHETGHTLGAYVVIAYGLPDQPGPCLALTTGVCRLDVVGYDRHVNDDYQDDGREYI